MIFKVLSSFWRSNLNYNLMPWPLYLAYKQLFPSGRRTPSFFFVVSTLGVSLGVALLIGVQSVMGGFGQTYREKIVQTTGHLEIKTGGIMYQWRPTLETLVQDERVMAAEPYAHGVVMLQSGNRPAFPFIRGISMAQEDQMPRVIPLDKFLLRGSLDNLDDDSVLLSSSLAMNVLASVGDIVELYTPLMLEKLKADEVLLPRAFRVAGIYETGWNQFDSSTMICTLRTMQDLYGLGDAVHGIAVRLQDGVNELRFTDELNAQSLMPPLQARAWLEINEDFLWVLALEKNILLLLMLFIVIVAAFAIAIAQLLTVLRKTREIGLLGAIGARPSELAISYCFQGFFLGLLGTTLGIGLALAVLHYRDSIVGFLASITQTQEMLVRFYQFAQLPVHYARQDFIIVIVATLVLSTLAGLIPAWRAARMKPAEALRAD